MLITMIEACRDGSAENYRRNKEASMQQSRGLWPATIITCIIPLLTFIFNGVTIVAPLLCCIHVDLPCFCPFWPFHPYMLQLLQFIVCTLVPLVSIKCKKHFTKMLKDVGMVAIN